MRLAKINHGRLAGILLAGLLAITGRAGELKVGDPVPAFTAKDQLGKEFKFAPGVKFLLLGFDMGTGRLANQKLAALGAGGLEKIGAVYVLDIHTMPAVGRFFALPKMRKYPQRIVLAENENLLTPFPRQPERITLLALTATGSIREIRFWNPASELPAAVLK